MKRLKALWTLAIYASALLIILIRHIGPWVQRLGYQPPYRLEATVVLVLLFVWGTKMARRGGWRCLVDGLLWVVAVCCGTLSLDAIVRLLAEHGLSPPWEALGTSAVFGAAAVVYLLLLSLEVPETGRIGSYRLPVARPNGVEHWN